MNICTIHHTFRRQRWEQSHFYLAITEEVLANVTIQSHEITPEKYGQGHKLMKILGYKWNGLIGINDKGIINPIKVTSRQSCDTGGLGVKKVLFHLGINIFIVESDSLLEPEYQSKSKK